MRLRSVAVVGGGPAGLFAARLLKLHHPRADVVVHELVEPAETFGFGVGIAVPTQRQLTQADRPALERIEHAAYRLSGARLQVGDAGLTIGDGSALSIGRTALLEELRELALEAGVTIRYGSRAEAASLAAADLVVAADGAGSRTRDALGAHLGVQMRLTDGFYMWCGADVALDTTLFTSATAEFGDFVAHAYPYAPTRSTFVIETDPVSFQAAGFDLQPRGSSAGQNDERSLAYLSHLFTNVLGGQPFIGNRSRWTQFRTVTCERWHVGNIVLIGDAAHTAHYSIGSGTKLALEDAIVLSDAIRSESSVAAALECYERERRPAVRRLQEAARRSERWWEGFMSRQDLPLDVLMLSYMTRTGHVDLNRLTKDLPDFAHSALAQFGPVPRVDDVGDFVLAAPFVRAGVHYASRVVSREVGARDAESVYVGAGLSRSDGTLLAHLASLARTASVVVLTGPVDPGAVVDRIDLGEQIVGSGPAAVVVAAPRSMKQEVAAAIAAGKVDLVTWQDEPEGDVR